MSIYLQKLILNAISNFTRNLTFVLKIENANTKNERDSDEGSMRGRKKNPTKFECSESVKI